jgi:hypothetical protein
LFCYLYFVFILFFYFFIFLLFIFVFIFIFILFLINQKQRGKTIAKALPKNEDKQAFNCQLFPDRHAAASVRLPGDIPDIGKEPGRVYAGFCRAVQFAGGSKH